jgi:hypothetical protein
MLRELSTITIYVCGIMGQSRSRIHAVRPLRQPFPIAIDREYDLILPPIIHASKTNLAGLR